MSKVASLCHFVTCNIIAVIIIDSGIPVYHIKNNIGMVQRRAAHFASQRYHNTSSVTDVLRKLQWVSLEH